MVINAQAQWEIPQGILLEAEKYFDAKTLQEAVKLLKLSRVSISFSKGSPETYFICSGIVKEDRQHESKVVFKNRLVGTPEGPINSNCDCHKWNEETHCPHSCALFLTYHLHLFHESNFDGVDENMSHPPVPLDSTFAVSAMEYGTIIRGPHQLERAPSSAAYSSLQYLLHSRKIINFPIPENFDGKLVIQITSSEHFNESTGQIENLPITRFKFRKPDGDVVREISLFENLYLFNWMDGTCQHLPPELKDLIQKMRLYASSLDINDLIKLVEGVHGRDKLEVIIDEVPLEEIPTVPAMCRIHLNKAAKKNQIEVNVIFHDENENIVQAPEFLKAFTFNGGLLNSFRRKKDAYDFLLDWVSNMENGGDTYKRFLLSSTQKNHWNTLIDYTLERNYSLYYSGKHKILCQYDNAFIKDFIVSTMKCFGEMFYRFSAYQSDSMELTFNVSGSSLFQGLSEFNTRLLPHGVNIYYNRNEISRWSSKIRFERKATSTKWFDLELNISDEDLELIQNADLDNGLALTKDGLVLLSKEQKDLLKFVKKYTDFESQNKFREESPEGNEEGPVNKFLLPFNRARIFELFELRKLGIDGALTDEEIALCERLATLEEVPEYPLPESLDGVLRPYQKTGYNWLSFLYENRLGACLADDMGLGKTLQTIAFLSSIYDKIDRVLIVCPVTILLNWESEFKKFSDIDIHIYHGGDRHLPDDAKIVLTSYGVMKREIEETFEDKEFDILVLDEVQHLKNIRSQGAFAARRIKSDFRVCLTGTPVENDLAEFYNILDLSIPGIWGDLQFIRTTSNKKSRLLARKTASPFILRRTKDQVLTDLPPKIENNVYLQFSDQESDLYKNSLVNIKKKIEIAPSKKKYGEILRGLLELRQRCLWQQNAKEADFSRFQIDSSKVKFLEETLEQIIEEGHQAIVFSQFTSYLDIIQNILREKHWRLARIDGSQTIKKRQEQVELFQSGQCPVFLISLKAGGVGLNLTAASYVFVMDPWWNPAVEAQAIDRAHRIGQQNTLTVYRPIIKGSVEEKVLELQKMKKELFQDLLSSDEDSSFSGKLTMKDFEALLT